MNDHERLPGAMHLECTATGEHVDSEQLVGLSAAGKPFFARYDLDRLTPGFTPDALSGRSADLWRYEEVLPVRDRGAQIRLGEGWTPLIDAPPDRGPARCRPGVGERRGTESDRQLQGPVGSVSPSPERSSSEPRSWRSPLRATLAARQQPTARRPGYPCTSSSRTTLLHRCWRRWRLWAPTFSSWTGSSATAAAWSRKVSSGTDGSTCRPSRSRTGSRGKRRWGTELLEQLPDGLPDAIVYPTGGGTGLIGMWKAFDEMERLGWIGPERPKMFTVQAAGCAPMVRAVGGRRGGCRALAGSRHVCVRAACARGRGGLPDSTRGCASRAAEPSRSRTTRWQTGSRS